MAYEIVLQQVAPRPLAVVAGRASFRDLASRIAELSLPVWQFVRSRGIETDGHTVVVYWDEDDRGLLTTEEGVPIEVGAGVLGPFSASEAVRWSATPGGLVAATRHSGPYDHLQEAHAAVREWCRLAGRAIAGPNWEVYSHHAVDERPPATDVFYLLR